MYQSNRGSVGRRATLFAIAAATVVAVVLVMLLQGGTAGANPREDFVAVSAGVVQTCGVTVVGGVECWGRVSWTIRDDRVGVGEPLPFRIPGLDTGNVMVSAKGESVCVITDDGGIQCWIRDEIPLGEVPSPNPVTGLSGPAVAVATVADSPCAVTATGSVECWGRTRFGQIGLEAEVRAGLESGVEAFTQGAGFACALLTSGSVECAGENENGQLGDGSTQFRNTFAPVSGLESGVSAIASGWSHTCALAEDGAVYCWGYNEGGELGGVGGRLSAVPVLVGGLSSGATQIRAGFGRTCAWLEAGSWECWGGQFGSTPSPLAEAESDVVDVTLGLDHACLLTEDGRVRCWGSNGAGQLGDGTTEPRASPVDVVAVAAKPAVSPTPCAGGECPEVTPAPPCAAEACMGLAVLDSSRDVVCHTALNQDCDLTVGSDFTLAVDAFAVPAQGYVGVQTFVYFGFPLEEMDLVFHPAVTRDDEVVWPERALVLGTVDTFPGAVSHGSLSGLLPPYTVSTYTGIIVELTMSCSPEESSTGVDLLPIGHPATGTSGTAYSMPPYGEIVTPDVSGLIVACCDETVTSVDALFILQFQAELTDTVSCGFDGDVNADGVIDSIDAALTLQFVAGLLEALPRDAG